MIGECVELTGRCLNHAQYGVNAYLANLPLTPGHERPPPVLGVFDEVNDDRAQQPDDSQMDSPVILVNTNGPVEFTGEAQGGRPRRGKLPLAIRLIYTGIPDAPRRRAMLYTLRAILRSLDQLTTEANVAVEHTLNQVTVISKETLYMGELDPAEVKDGIHAGAILLDLFFQDATPNAAPGQP